MVYSTVEVERIVSEYITESLKHVDAIEEIWLFGSYATGKAREDSDIDLAVISPLFEDETHLNTTKKFYRVLWDMKQAIDIEVHGFTREEFEKGWMGEEIRRTGKCVWKNGVFLI